MEQTKLTAKEMKEAKELEAIERRELRQTMKDGSLNVTKMSNTINPGDKQNDEVDSLNSPKHGSGDNENQFAESSPPSRINNLDTSRTPRDDLQSPFKKSRYNTSVGSKSSTHRMTAAKLQGQVKEQHNQLTVERAQAMRLLTNKLQKVAKVPIEMHNKFCSHIDPVTSGQLIAANDLAEHSRAFGSMWTDKEHRFENESFKTVPKHYYSNYKSNLVRDAHVSMHEKSASRSPLKHM